MKDHCKLNSGYNWFSRFSLILLVSYKPYDIDYISYSPYVKFLQCSPVRIFADLLQQRWHLYDTNINYIQKTDIQACSRILRMFFHPWSVLLNDVSYKNQMNVQAEKSK